MNSREFADLIHRPRGTVRRWLREGLPHRKYGLRVVIDLVEATRWVQEHDVRAGDRRHNKVTRQH